MELRTLRYVIAVADRLSFTAAARDLNVSQPALSQQIRQLEDELGLQLFARTPHRVALTQGGQLVVEHARRTLENAGRLREAVGAFRGLHRGKLRLAVTQSFNALYLSPALATFLERHPSIDVTALELANGEIIAGVANGTLDLGVAFGAVDAPISSRLLYEDQLMLACSADHPLASLPRVPLQALRDVTLALLTVNYGTRRALDRFFENHELAANRIIEMDTFGAILKLVETGACVSVLPGSADGNRLGDARVVFRLLEPAPPTRSVQLLLPPPAARAPSAVAFGDILIERFKARP